MWNRALIFWALLVHLGKQVVAWGREGYEINSPKDYARFWKNNDVSDSINPCLYGSNIFAVETNIRPLYPDKSTNAFFWSADSIALQSWLQLNKSDSNGKVAVSQMLGSVGIFPNYTYVDHDTLILQPLDTMYFAGKCYLYVFDGCRAKNSIFKLQSAKPTPSFMMDVMRSEQYNVSIPQVLYNDMATAYWNDAEKVFGDGRKMTKAEAYYCLASSNFAANLTDCNADSSFLEVYNHLQKFNPENGRIDRPARMHNPLRFGNCIRQLKNFEPLTLPMIRAAMWVCFGASPWNTGIGVTWSGGFNGLEFSKEYSHTDFARLPRGLLNPEYLWPMVSFGILKGELIPTATFP